MRVGRVSAIALGRLKQIGSRTAFTTRRELSNSRISGFLNLSLLYVTTVTMGMEILEH